MKPISRQEKIGTAAISAWTLGIIVAAKLDVLDSVIAIVGLPLLIYFAGCFCEGRAIGLHEGERLLTRWQAAALILGVLGIMVWHFMVQP